MKNFFQFLTEASLSQASMQAHKLNLKSDGHGGWLDSRGNFVAKTESGKLKFVTKKDLPAQEKPGAKKTAAPAPAPKQPKAKPEAAAQPKAPTKQAPTQQAGPTETDTVTVVFGRFNPPTIGHEKLLKTAEKVAEGGDLKIYPSRTQDPKKNPLDPDMKISYMKKMFPDFSERIINDDQMVTIFDVLTTAAQEGYLNVNIVVGADRQAEFENLALKYNGDLYEFDLIRVVSAGVRDADAEGVEGMSASKMRKAVLDNDFKAFRRGTPKTLDDGDTQALFDAVRQGMSIKKKKSEVAELWQIAPKYDPQGLREHYVRGLIYRIGDIVENLNTGLVGKIIRRGTNHLICLTKEDYMFKSWIKDVMEYTEVKMERKMRAPGKPNTLAGTGGYFKYAVDMTPGFEKGDATNLQYGAKAYSGYKQSGIREFINKYKAKK